MKRNTTATSKYYIRIKLA